MVLKILQDLLRQAADRLIVRTCADLIGLLSDQKEFFHKPELVFVFPQDRFRPADEIMHALPADAVLARELLQRIIAQYHCLIEFPLELRKERSVEIKEQRIFIQRVESGLHPILSSVLWNGVS